ncbi:epoxyqueuosine reductase QueH, partial [Elusimicrobiota bacterium]
MNIENKLLLHICCAPCTSYPHKELKNEGYAVSGYWCNSNVHGFQEHQKRLMSMGYYLSANRNMEFIEDNYEPEKWFEEISDHSSPARCSKCYKVRLESTARTAREHSIDNFTTTLLYS